MANEGNYKGIVVKFGADPTPLSEALRDIDAQAKGVSADIREIEKGLKIDPKNIDLTVQKIQRLGDGIQTASRRLEMLKAAQADARRAIEEGSDGAEQRYKDLQREITRTGNELERLRKQARETGEAMKADMLGPIDSLKDKLDDLKKKSLTAAVAAVGAGLIGVTKSAVESYAEYEQLVGGVETLFKNSADTVLRYAERAYQTAGLSANQYLSTVTSFSASLLQGLDGDTAKAAKLSDQAITDMADNANKMGTSIESIQNAYQGFAKQNYTMLDNLKLGYGGTASEMARLINDSGVLGDKITVTAKTVNSVSFDKMIEAVHAVQTELGITGTTAQEAEQTISGSLNAVKAAWSNLMTGLGDESADTEKLTKQFTDALNTFIDNIKPVIKQALKGIGATLREVLPDELIDGLEFLYGLISRVGEVFKAHSQEIIAAAAAYKTFKTAMAIKDVVQNAVTALKGFKAATDAAKTSQDAMNASAAANPYALIAATVALAITGIMKFTAAQYEANAAYGDFFDSVEKELEKNSEAVRSYDQLKDKIEQNRQAREKAAADIEGEYYGYEKLVERLYELNEVQNKSTADKAEMAEIVQKLESGVDGLAIAFDKETGALSTQRSELEQAIEKTKELALAQAAVKNQEELASDIVSVTIDRDKLSREMENVFSERKKIADEAAEKYGIAPDELSSSALHSLHDNMNGNYQAQEKEELEALIKQIDELDARYSALLTRENEANRQLDELNAEYDLNAAAIEKNSEQLKEKELAERNAAKAAGETVEVVKESADAIEEQTKAFEDAEKRAASYKGEVEALIDLYQRSAAEVRLTTKQMNDLIDKYPELIRYVKRTSDGYKIEAEEIEDLIEQKSKLMLAEKQEAEELARKEAMEAAEAYGSARITNRLGLTNLDLEELKKQADKAQEIYQSAMMSRQGYESVTERYINKSYANETESSAVVQKADTADYWKQAAEAEIAEAEHLYKMGEISAAEYYKRLEDINRRYYEGRTEYLEEYRKLEETVYAGLKKQQEDQLSSMKALLERINAVRDARRQLESAENQKVNVYSSAAGFHIEDDRAAIEKAADSLQSKTLELASLLQQKYGMDISMPDISGLDLSALLPDLSGLRIPGGTVSSRQVTVNYQAGDIYISGSADSGTVDRLRALMNSESRKFFEEYLTDYLDRADMDRQTGG